jgi:hypothetical protein
MRSASNASFLIVMAATAWFCAEQPPLPEIPVVPSIEQPLTTQSTSQNETNPIDPAIGEPVPMPFSDPNSDPLFLEIKKMLMKDKFDSEAQSNNAAAKAVDLLDKAESIHESKWKAVQHLMQASQCLNRSIELDLAANRIDQAAKDRTILKQIRVQILSLLVD